MNRRRFITTSGGLVAAAGFSPLHLAAEAAGLEPGRSVYPIQRRWKYSPRVVPGIHEPTFDDRALETVILPHSNISLPWHGLDNRDYEFISVYRRRLRLPSGLSAKRVFVDFEGVMIASKVYCNGELLGEYRGGYTPFSVELTDALRHHPETALITIEVDSRERADIPPFGNEVDYLTFGGMYREVWLRVVPQIFIENIHARTVDVLTDRRAVEVDVYLDRAPGVSTERLEIRAKLMDGQNVLADGGNNVGAVPVTVHHPIDCDQHIGSEAYDPRRDAPAVTVTLLAPSTDLWRLRSPKLYSVKVELLHDGQVIDADTCRIGFRDARFTDQGFSLNGEIVKLHGLDRHQMFPWVGQAMSARGQKQDAVILRREFHCNMVRTSHYPQSRHFLNACDELGLLVLEEIPGWQFIGDRAWQDVSVDNVRRMVRRDWNRPSVVLWAVRINESPDDHDFYTRTNALARALDATRQTCGIRPTSGYNSEFLEDVFTYNDFDWPLKAPNHSRFLNTEFVGHTFPTKSVDAYERQREHLVRHARVHDTLASDAQYSGGLGWCAFDYATHDSFGSGDRICYHGVMDIFRTPKPAAFFYKSMADREDEIVLEPAFYWARNDESVNFSRALLCGNVDSVRITTHNDKGEHLIAEGGPNRMEFPHLRYPPFTFDVGAQVTRANWGDLKIEGLIEGKTVISRVYSGSGIDRQFVMLPDETALLADGADAVRIVLRVTDEFGNLRHFAADAIELRVEGPGTLIGDNPMGLIGGRAAIWIRTTERPGTIIVTGRHPRLGSAAVSLSSTLTPQENV